jgi:hypothetical protein
VAPPADAAAFARLRTLLLANNRLADWCAPPPAPWQPRAAVGGADARLHRASVDALDGFPALLETRLSGNPLVEAAPHTRHEVVARVRSLSLLNGSLVGHAERRDAEIRYLRRALDEAGGAAGVQAAPAAAAARHPRIEQLMVRQAGRA